MNNIDTEILKRDTEFLYMFLSRLQMDCDYFLAYDKRFIKHLYYDSVNKHIETMKAIYNHLTIKPEWLTWDNILEYEKGMK